MKLNLSGDCFCVASGMQDMNRQRMDWEWMATAASQIPCMRINLHEGDTAMLSNHRRHQQQQQQQQYQKVAWERIRTR